jgi:hypothetical protein
MSGTTLYSGNIGYHNVKYFDSMAYLIVNEIQLASSTHYFNINDEEPISLNHRP